MLYYGFLTLRRLVLIFPRAFCYRVAGILAFFYYLFAFRDRRAVMYNIAPFITDKKEARRVCRRVFANFSYYLIDFFRYDKLTREFVDQYVTITGRDLLDASLKKHDGAILLTAHLGNYELGAAAISLSGYNMSAVALPHRDARTNKLFDRQRNKVGIRVIPTGVSVKECFGALKVKGALGLLGDRVFAGKAIPAVILGRTVLLPRGFAFFARKANVDIVPSFFVRENKNFYRLIFEEPIKIDDHQDDESIVAAYAKVLEKYIVKYPDQWYSFVKYWV
jgi:Kdo2-lipid IVA lauroyltransferase/acyltransferase